MWFRNVREVASYIMAFPPEDRPKELVVEIEEYVDLLADPRALPFSRQVSLGDCKGGPDLRICGVRIRVMHSEEISP